MLGFLYTANGNKSPTNQPFEGLTGNELNPDDAGREIRVFKIDGSAPHPYLMPGADPGEGFFNTNYQLFSTDDPAWRGDSRSAINGSHRRQPKRYPIVHSRPQRPPRGISTMTSRSLPVPAYSEGLATRTSIGRSTATTAIPSRGWISPTPNAPTRAISAISGISRPDAPTARSPPTRFSNRASAPAATVSIPTTTSPSASS